jgi:hypothetical protein
MAIPVALEHVEGDRNFMRVELGAVSGNGTGFAVSHVKL